MCNCINPVVERWSSCLGLGPGTGRVCVRPQKSTQGRSESFSVWFARQRQSRRRGSDNPENLPVREGLGRLLSGSLRMLEVQ